MATALAEVVIVSALLLSSVTSCCAGGLCLLHGMWLQGQILPDCVHSHL